MRCIKKMMVLGGEKVSAWKVNVDGRQLEHTWEFKDSEFGLDESDTDTVKVVGR